MNRKQFGRYEIISRLGRGGMAEVYKAYQSSLERYVAIKLLHPFLADDPEFKERFEREARNVARLRHPNIVQVYDFEYDAESESYYMVMELIEGKTLKDRLTEMGNTRLPINEILRLVRGAAEALAYAHSRGMIHRDVKPANLMLDEDGRVVLTDFGIAKIVTGIQFTASGGMVGTPAYMAPEQGLGEAGDERSDVYSLGVILYQLVTGALPYDAPTPLATILKHLNEPIPNPRDLNPDIPEAVEKIIYKAMAKEPEERYQSAQDMLVDINAAMGLPAPAPLTVTDTTPLPGDKSDDTKSKRSTLEAQNPTLAGTTVVRRPVQRSMVAGVSIIGVILVIALFAVLFSGGKLPFLVSLFSSPTFTPTITPIPTQTPTITATLTPSLTETPTVTLTPSITFTPTPNLTETLGAATSAVQSQTAAIPATTFSAFLTQLAHTPTATLTPNYTATILKCVKAYRRTDFVPPKQDPIPIFSAPGTPNEFTRTITLLNTSTCDWLPGSMYLSFIPGSPTVDSTDFGAGQQIPMNGSTPVPPGGSATFTFRGTPPQVKGQYKGGTYNSQWEVHMAPDVVIEPTLTISYFLYEN